MTELLLGVAMLACSTAPAPPEQPPHVAVAPRIFNVERYERPFRDPVPERRAARTAAATTKGSRVDRIIAIAAGVSIGWVVGGGIGYGVTPKRGPYDDTSGLKGMMIGAPVGAVAGALLGYRLTK